MRPRLTMRALLVVSMIAAGLLPMTISSVVITKDATATMHDSTFRLLSSEIEVRKQFLENYLKNTETLSRAMAENLMVTSAMRDFTESFNKLPSDLGRENGALESEKRKVERFYQTDFSQQYASTGQTVPATSSLVPRTDSGTLAQLAYIANNKNPLGEKDVLNSAFTSSDYDIAHARYHPSMRTFQAEFGFYDVFLIEPEEGNVVYSVYKEIDYATSMFNGPHRDSGLAEVTRQALNLPEGRSTIVDFADYIPSYNSPASFIASPIYENNELLGVIVIQIPINKINEIMSTGDSFGETGELMLLGEDQLMRSQSRFSEENTVLRQSIETQSVSLAMQGQTGVLEETTNGVEYLSSYAPLSINGLNWVMAARMEASEALEDEAILIQHSIIIMVISALVVTLMAYFVGRYLFGLLGGDPADLRRAADAIGNGDLSSHDGDEDSIGTYQSIVTMRNKLRSILGESIQVAEEVRKGANELSDANVGLSERTEQQATNLEETASSTEQITSTVKHNAENTRNANELAIQTRERAVATGEVALRAVTAMQEITSASERIADIISVIDEIAFQTNLLALNAAVEAARAGEQGRGFAVVATEVRQLAGRSASAAKEIKDLIEDSVSKVKDGTRLVQESGGELEQIVTSVSSLTDIVGQISVASNEQASGIEQINQALVHMDSVTQQNAAMVEQAASTSRAMRDQAALLSSQIGFFAGDSVQSLQTPGDGGFKGPIVSPVAHDSVVSESANAANSKTHTPAMKKASGGDEFWDEF